jgi:hypothetical protein
MINIMTGQMEAQREIPPIPIPQSLPDPTTTILAGARPRHLGETLRIQALKEDLRERRPDLSDADMHNLSLAAGDLAIELNLTALAALRVIASSDEIITNILSEDSL